MVRKSFIASLFLCVFASICLAQNDIKIKKKIQMKIPELASMPDNLPQATKDSIRDSMNSAADIYLKGTRMRTDTKYKVPSMTGKLKTRTNTLIVDSSKQQSVQFNDNKKKYYVDSWKADANAKKGGYVNVSITVTDTGERMKLFGYDSRHIKQKITITPGANARQKSNFQMEIDGWYAEIPSYSFPAMPDLTEMQTQKGCFDEVVFEMKGGTITGVPVKEIKTMTIDGKIITIEEEIVQLAKTTLDAALFEPPADYKPANTKAEVNKDDETQTSQTERPFPINNQPANNQPISNTAAPTLAPPSAGVAANAPQPKQAGVIRIGIAKPKVTAPDSKKDPGAGDEIGRATAKALVESLKAENIEAIELSSDSPESECKEKMCDYIFYANITQKRGGGGMFGKMIAMGAMTMVGGMIPGVGGMVASTVASQVMNQTMGKAAKAKDEFTLEYKVVGLNNAVLTQAVTKAKTKQDGEDVLTPQIQQAAKTVIGAIAK